MGIDKYSDKAIEKLRKTGKATLVFTVEAYTGDENFKSAPPLIDLYVIPRKPHEDKPPEQLPINFNKGIISINTERPAHV